MKRDYLSLNDLRPNEVEMLIKRAVELKAGRRMGLGKGILAGKTLGMLFNKPSMRTRVSFEVGVVEFGGHVVILSDQEVGLGTREPIPHAARVMSRYLDGLIIRTYAQADLVEMAQNADVPVINALTDEYHPCQLLADLQTVFEHKGRINDLRIAWVGDGYNMAHSWINAATHFPFDLRIAVPEGYDPDPEILESGRNRSKGSIMVTHDPVEAVKNADVINTDVWASMGRESEAEARADVFRPFQLNAALMAHTADDAIVLHCLPAHLGQEITEDVIESSKSVVFDQAENRLHAQKALMEFLLV